MMSFDVVRGRPTQNTSESRRNRGYCGPLRCSQGATGSDAGTLASTTVGPVSSWRDRAACVGLPVSWFFIEHGDKYAAAAELCAGCPVRAECDWEADQLPGLLAQYGFRAEITGAVRVQRRHQLAADRSTR